VGFIVRTASRFLKAGFSRQNVRVFEEKIAENNGS
jgi:hypothetical protein